MNSVKQTAIGALAGVWAILALCGGIVAQDRTEGAAPGISSVRGAWQQRVLRRGRANEARAGSATAPKYRIARSAHQRPIRALSTAVQSGNEGVDLPADQVEFDPLATDPAYGPAVGGGAEMMDHGPGCDDCVDCGGESCGACGGSGECGRCDAGGVCDGCYGGHPYTCGGGPGGCGLGFFGLRQAWWARDLSFHAGAHGFKGPPDQGRNGNFGLHEGVNFGAPLGGPWGLGYQVGVTAVHSNFSGDQADLGASQQVAVRHGDRDQIFLTAGIFRRALCGGLQWGVAFDLLRDSYYARADLKQIRTETGYVFSGGRREVGYFGAYGTGDDNLIILQRESYVRLEPTDLFAVYYRRHFAGGGDGRVWGGFTGGGDGLIGADIRVPIGKSWAIENRVNYLIPKQGRGTGQAEESWGLSMNLVWYFGTPSRCVDSSPFRPMFSVADNTSFMSDRFENPIGP